jgi:3'(2'), 5'-bisphosphate nucleotidase
LTLPFKAYPAEADFALSAVRAAAALGSQVQETMVTPELIKDDRSPVTVADFACQALVSQILDTAFPEDPLVAEESSRSLHEAGAGAVRRAVTRHLADVLGEADEAQVEAWIDRGQGTPAGRFWTLDPVDGTAGFLRHDHWVVALALIEDGQVHVGALACPRLAFGLENRTGPSQGMAAVAVRGGGAWGSPLESDEWIRLQVSDCSDPTLARLLASVEAGHTNLEQLDRLERELGVSVPPVRMDSQAKYAALASGLGDLIFRLLSPQKPNYREKIWDQAAGSLIVEEAGGQVSDLRGEPLDFSAGRTLDHNLGVLVSNRRLHAQALQALAAVGTDRPSGGD